MVYIPLVIAFRITKKDTKKKRYIEIYNRKKKKKERKNAKMIAMAIFSFSNSNSKLGGGPKGYPVIFDRLVEIIFSFFQSCGRNTTTHAPEALRS